MIRVKRKLFWTTIFFTPKTAAFTSLFRPKLIYLVSSSDLFLERVKLKFDEEAICRNPSVGIDKTSLFKNKFPNKRLVLSLKSALWVGLIKAFCKHDRQSCSQYSLTLSSCGIILTAWHVTSRNHGLFTGVKWAWIRGWICMVLGKSALLKNGHSQILNSSKPALSKYRKCELQGT